MATFLARSMAKGLLTEGLAPFLSKEWRMNEQQLAKLAFEIDKAMQDIQVVCRCSDMDKDALEQVEFLTYEVTSTTLGLREMIHAQKEVD